MEMNVNNRYQSPGEMLAELKAAMQRLKEPYTPAVEEESPPLKSASEPTVPLPSLMFVESNVALQDILRQRLKKNGYRVLVTADPDRALSRFTADTQAADCVIFSTGELGEAALDAFNRFGEGQHTARIPAVLLLDEHHTEWKAKAKLNKHRVVVSMPIKLRSLREVLSQLVPTTAAAADSKIK
jgi:DNA-binding response OmpR family regulator